MRNQKLQILTRVSIILPFRGHTFMTSAKGKILTTPPFTFRAIRFWSVPPSAALQWMSIIEFRRTSTPEEWYFEIFLISFNSEINIFIHSFFSLLKLTMFTSLMSLIKLTGKQTHVNWAYFHDKFLYLFCFYDWILNQTSLEDAVRHFSKHFSAVRHFSKHFSTPGKQ